jgi:L-ascorbate metabolism protein UlaG (beta-lactamase superfamily)
MKAKKHRRPGRRPKGVITRSRVARKMALAMLMPMRRVPRRAAPRTMETDKTAVTYIGHATTLLQTAGMNLITDPIFSRRILFLRRLIEPGVPFHNLPRVDAILLSHAHMDHCDIPTLRRFPKHTPVICPRDVGDLPRRAGLRDVIELETNESVSVGKVRVTSIPVRHFGHRYFRDTHRGYTAFLVEGGSRSIFFGGDTAYDPRFQQIGREHAVDIAILPVGAYRPDAFRAVHCNPPDAIRAYHDLGAKWLVPIHWGTFILSYEPIDEPIEWLAAIRDHQKMGDSVVILEHGERRVF